VDFTIRATSCADTAVKPHELGATRERRVRGEEEGTGAQIRKRRPEGAAHIAYEREADGRALRTCAPTTRVETTRGTQRTVEPAVLPSEIEQLPDLAGYLKLASRGAWLTTKLPSTEMGR
jgi:hypothetical protein